ncbi:MAG: TIGR00366 family protein [Deltaproteobacteria bacterium]|nr:TIGR00366 family protein [Deltaproteobacteria bacterium]
MILQKLASASTRWSTRWVPDSWVIAVLLTIVAYILGLIFTKSTPFQLVQSWGLGFWVLLSFAMQMCLIIMTGYILATTPLVSRGLNYLAGLPKSPKGAIALMAVVSMGLAWINWGLSIVGSAVFTRFIVKKQKGVDYRLLVATAYLGLGTFWHSGLSASAPLLVATPGHFLVKDMGIIPITETIFHPFNLGLAAVVLVFLTILGPMMHPKKGDEFEVDPKLVDEATFTAPVKPTGAALTPALRMEHSPVINLIVGISGLIWMAWYFGTKGWAGINLDVVNFMFLMVGVLLHWTPASFLKAANEGGSFIWGVAVQFPFYAGIFGIIKFSGLAEVMSGWFTAIATKETYPFIVMWYSGILNYIVPSGGSKWAIEAPYIIQAAKTLGVSTPVTVIAYAWGDMVTDIIQPFWAIPLLGVAKLEFRDIMGYCMIYFLFYMVVISIAFWFMPYFFGY